MPYVQDAVPSAPYLMDRINRKTWSERSTLDRLRKLEGWSDPGERAALERVTWEAKDQAILDLGVRGGRTVPLLRAISHDYVAIDCTPELVEACKTKYPYVHVEHGDARDLSRFADASFKLVVFSSTGIDAVNPDDRAAILRGVHRVLRNDGILLFSTHNHEGPGHRVMLSFGIRPTRNLVKLAVRVVRAAVRSIRTLHNYGCNSKLNWEGDGYSITNAAAHSHGLLIHYISLNRQLRELENAGFRAGPVVFDNIAGELVKPDQDTSAISWFHFVARK